MCTQEYVTFSCGHQVNSEFFQCSLHSGKDTRCSVTKIKRVEKGISGHRCRTCLASVCLDLRMELIRRASRQPVELLRVIIERGNRLLVWRPWDREANNNLSIYYVYLWLYCMLCGAFCLLAQDFKCAKTVHTWWYRQSSWLCNPSPIYLVLLWKIRRIFKVGQWEQCCAFRRVWIGRRFGI